MALGDLAVSTGSACSVRQPDASHVLEAIGATSVRRRRRSASASAGRPPKTDIDFAIDRVSTVVVERCVSSLRA